MNTSRKNISALMAFAEQSASLPYGNLSFFHITPVMRTYLLFFVLLLFAPLSFATEIRHRLDLNDNEHHYLHISSVFPCDTTSLSVYMASWTPGSYKIREFARNVDSVSFKAPGGETLPWRKTAKDNWQVDCLGQKSIEMHYRLYARTMTVRTSWLDSEFAMLNFASVLLVPEDMEHLPHRLTLNLPDNWQGVYSALGQENANTFLADDFDTLLDSPLVAGNPDIQTFNVRGIEHKLVTIGDSQYWDLPKAASDLEKMVKEHAAFWESIPYKNYIFFNLLVEKGGGLEHKASTIMMSSRWKMRKREDYVKWLALASHEFFHTWNIKRLRPEALGPFDYRTENYSASLWLAEGFTSYYESLLNLRAGIISESEFLKLLAADIQNYSERPGNQVQALADASKDSWIKYYIRDENSINTTVSYYNGGATVAFGLDALIRKESHGRKSLDDVMRALYRQYAGATGYPDEAIYETVADVAGSKARDWLEQYTLRPGVPELDFAYQYLGLDFDTGKKPIKDDAPAWLGLVSKTHNDRIIVKEVKTGTPIWEAGANAEDELLAIDGYRVTAGNYEKRLGYYRPGESLVLLLARRGKLLKTEAVAAARPGKNWQLKSRDKATGANMRARKNWWSSSGG